MISDVILRQDFCCGDIWRWIVVRETENQLRGLNNQLNVGSLRSSLSRRRWNKNIDGRETPWGWISWMSGVIKGGLVKQITWLIFREKKKIKINWVWKRKHWVLLQAGDLSFWHDIWIKTSCSQLEMKIDEGWWLAGLRNIPLRDNFMWRKFSLTEKYRGQGTERLNLEAHLYFRGQEEEQGDKGVLSGSSKTDWAPALCQKFKFPTIASIYAPIYLPDDSSCRIANVY